MTKRWWIPLAVVFIGILGFQSWQLHKMKRRLDDLEWSVAVDQHSSDNVITPEVGTIQFLKTGGYSIQLDAAKYLSDGLYLKGFVGNPTNLWISNLALKFSAQKNLYEYRNEFEKDKFSFEFGPTAIGDAQCSPIPTLAPGTKQLFEVTIPNVKQTKEGIRIVVTFTGERYSYNP